MPVLRLVRAPPRSSGGRGRGLAGCGTLGSWSSDANPAGNTLVTATWLRGFLRRTRPPQPPPGPPRPPDARTGGRGSCTGVVDLGPYQQADPETIRKVVLHPTHPMVSR